MISQELLGSLWCPETKQSLTLIEGSFITKLNKKIRKGEITNRDGSVLSKFIDGALLREDKKYFYPIVNNIPVLLISEGIEYTDS